MFFFKIKQQGDHSFMQFIEIVNNFRSKSSYIYIYIYMYCLKYILSNLNYEIHKSFVTIFVYLMAMLSNVCLSFYNWALVLTTSTLILKIWKNQQPVKFWDLYLKSFHSKCTKKNYDQQYILAIKASVNVGMNRKERKR